MTSQSVNTGDSAKVSAANIGSALTGTSPSSAISNTSTENTKEKEALDLVLQRFRRAYNFAQKLHTRFDELYQLYMGYTKTENAQTWQSNIFVPTAFTVIETLLPKTLAAFFGEKFIVRILPRDAKDIPFVRIITALTRYQFTRMKAFSKFYLWFKTTLTYGIGVMETGWRYEEREQTVYEPNTINVPFYGPVKIGRRKVRKKIIRYDDPDCRVIDIYDFFWAPRATTIKDAKYVIHREWKHIDDVVNDPYFNDNKHELKKDKDSGGMSTDMTKSVRITARDADDPASEDDNEMILLYRYWEDNRNIVVANEKYVLYDGENPNDHGEKPYQLLKDVEMPHEMVGRGEIEPIKALIYERNEIRSQRLDNIKTIVNRKLIVDKNADVDLDTIDEDNRPGGIILTDNVDALKYLQETDIVASSFQEDNAISRDIQEASAMGETTIGIMPRRGETATSINAQTESAMSRFALKIQMFAETGVLDFVDTVIRLNAQYITKKRVVRIVGPNGEEWKDISCEDITMNYDYASEIGQFQVRQQVEKQQWLELISSLANMSQFGAQFNWNEISKETFRKFEQEEPDRFMLADQPPTDPMQQGMSPELAAGGTPPKPKGVASRPGVPLPPVKR